MEGLGGRSRKNRPRVRLHREPPLFAALRSWGSRSRILRQKRSRTPRTNPSHFPGQPHRPGALDRRTGLLRPALSVFVRLLVRRDLRFCIPAARPSRASLRCPRPDHRPHRRADLSKSTPDSTRNTSRTPRTQAPGVSDRLRSCCLGLDLRLAQKHPAVAPPLWTNIPQVHHFKCKQVVTLIARVPDWFIHAQTVRKQLRIQPIENAADSYLVPQKYLHCKSPK